MNQASVKSHNLAVFSSLEEGDIIRFQRDLFYHFAVYKGGGYVVHFGKDEDGNLFVQQDGFFNVCKNSKAEKYNYLDGKLKPREKDTIVERAVSLIGTKGYNFFVQNCEHFATFCRYGRSWSQQVMDGLSAMIFLFLVLLTAVVVMVFHCGSMFITNIMKRLKWQEECCRPFNLLWLLL